MDGATRGLYGAIGLLMMLVGPWVHGQGNDFEPLSSNPEDVVVIGDWVYFSAEDGRRGRELWRTDIDGNAECIKELTRGAEGSEIYAFYPFRGMLYFGYRPTGEKGQLWRSDGTAAGTVMVSRCVVEDQIQSFNEIVDHTENSFFFTTGEEVGSKLLWQSNGTEEGTKLIREAEARNPVAFNSFHGTTSGEDLYFNMDWKKESAIARVDGATALAHVIRGFVSETNSYFTMDSGDVLFQGWGPDSGGELWRTGPTSDSCQLVLDIYPGPESSGLGDMHRFVSDPFGVMILFVAKSPDYGRELWTTDGTPEGTRLWKDLLDGAPSSNPYRLISEPGVLFFVAIGEGIGKEMWRYDANTDAFRAISDINPGLGSSEPYATWLTSFGLYFSAQDEYQDEELYCFDGTEKQAVRVADIYPGQSSSYPSYTTSFGGAIVFVATNPIEGRELQIKHPNEAHRVLVDIWSDGSVNPASSPNQFTVFGDRMVFVANDLHHGNELWVSDGTSTGTVLLKDILRGRKSSNPSQLTVVGDLLYFVADDGIHGYELWRTDGTTEGTTLPFEIAWPVSPEIRHLTAFKGNLLFRANREGEGAELWIVRPGREPDVLKDINAGPGSSNPSGLVVWNDHVYFQADDGTNGAEVWRTDGSEVGTVMLKDVVSVPLKKISAREMQPGLGRLFLAAEVDDAGAEVWSYSEGGNVFSPVRDIASPSAFNVLNPAYPSAP